MTSQLITWWYVATVALYDVMSTAATAEGLGECADYNALCNNEDSRFYQPCPSSSEALPWCEYTPGGSVGEGGQEFNTQPGGSGMKEVLILSPQLYRTDVNHARHCQNIAVNISWVLSTAGTQAASAAGGWRRRIELRFSKWTKLFDEESDNIISSSHNNINEMRTDTRIVYFNVTLSSSNSTLATNNITMYYDCFKVSANTTYAISITSSTVTNSAEKPSSSVSEIRFSTGNLGSYYYIPPPGDSADWAAISWITVSESQRSINICFTLAPPSYEFKTYLVELVDASSGDSNLVKYAREISIGGNEGYKICTAFYDVCRGKYTAFVSAVNAGGELCKRNNKPVMNCSKTRVRDVDMMQSNAIEGDDRCRPSPKPINRVLAGVLGSTLALLALILISCALYWRKRCKSQKVTKCKKPLPQTPDVTCKHVIDRRQPVLILYSHDNDSHIELVCRFATFLNSRCSCDVMIDSWAASDVTRLGSAQWLLGQLDKAENIILVHSLGARHKYTGSIKGIGYESLTDCKVDMFLPAVHYLQEQILKPSALHRRIFHVYFPHTSTDDVIDLHLYGRSGLRPFSLMSKFDELFLNIHNLSKFDPRGKAQVPNFLSEGGYTECVEGKALCEAIQQAVVYHTSNPGWFQLGHREIIEGHRNEGRGYKTGSDTNNNSNNNNNVESVSSKARTAEQEQCNMNKEIRSSEEQGKNDDAEASERSGSRLDSGLSSLVSDPAETSYRSPRRPIPDFYMPQGLSLSLSHLDGRGPDDDDDDNDDNVYRAYEMNNCSTTSVVDVPESFVCFAPDSLSDDSQSVTSSVHQRFKCLTAQLNDSQSLAADSTSTCSNLDSYPRPLELSSSPLPLHYHCDYKDLKPGSVSSSPLHYQRNHAVLDNDFMPQKTFSNYDNDNDFVISAQEVGYINDGEDLNPPQCFQQSDYSKEESIGLHDVSFSDNQYSTPADEIELSVADSDSAINSMDACRGDSN